MVRILLATAAAAVPIPHAALLKIDRAAGYRNFLPTRAGGVLRVEFKTKSGAGVEWRVLPMAGSCEKGKQQSFQLGGNKVWWARNAKEQFAWRCVFDQAGKPIKLEAASSAPTNEFAPAGLGVIVAHAKRY